MDEFEITATHPKMPDRVWTRDTYSCTKFIADSTIIRLGYHKAVVVNTFGGDRSDVLYQVMATHSQVSG